jgi:glycosyltransferase involved in cell wall biosynthesis
MQNNSHIVDSEKRRIIFLCFDNPMCNMRILRASQAAKNAGYNVYAVGLENTNIGPPSAKQYSFTPKNILLVKNNMNAFNWRAQTATIGLLSKLFPMEAARQFLFKHLPYHNAFDACAENLFLGLNTERALSDKDIIFAEHWQVGLAAKNAKHKYGCRIIYDLSELPIVEFSNNKLWDFLMPELVHSAEAQIIDEADTTISVIPSANYYFEKFYNKDIKSHFIPNQVLSGIERPRLDLRKKSNRVIYFGGIRPHRGIETMIEALKFLPDTIVFDCRGYGKKAYLKALRTKAQKLDVQHRFNILDPVSPDCIMDNIIGYACGLSAFDPASPQLQMAQPNKVFLYLKAGLPFLVSKTTTLATQIKDMPFADVVEWDNPIDLAKKISLFCASRMEITETSYNDFLVHIKAENFSDLFKQT